MSFRLLLEAAQAQAISEKLAPTEEGIWAKYCREYSVRFHTPLLEVMAMNPMFVLSQVNADNLSDLDVEENLQNIQDTLNSLQDPEYDTKKEQAIREEMRQIQEREEKRLKEGRAIHPSLEKDKRIIAADSSILPKSGGINMGLINRLNNSDKEG